MPDVTTGWQRSSYCADGNCVEVGRVGDQVVIRDSKNADASPIMLTTQDWSGFREWLGQTEKGH